MNAERTGDGRCPNDASQQIVRVGSVSRAWNAEEGQIPLVIFLGFLRSLHLSGIACQVPKNPTSASK
jgi:hypothetical protein